MANYYQGFTTVVTLPSADQFVKDFHFRYDAVGIQFPSIFEAIEDDKIYIGDMSNFDEMFFDLFISFCLEKKIKINKKFIVSEYSDKARLGAFDAFVVHMYTVYSEEFDLWECSVDYHSIHNYMGSVGGHVND